MSETAAQDQREPLTAVPEPTVAKSAQQEIASSRLENSETSKKLPSFRSLFQSETALHKRISKRWWVVIGALSFAVIAMVAVGVYTYSVAMTLRAQAMAAEPLARRAYDNFKAQNLPAVEQDLNELSDQLDQIETTYAGLGMYRYVPIARGYYSDGEHGLRAARAGLSAGQKSIAAITPYADVLGFSGEGSFEGGTAEDRLKVILETVDKVLPIMDEVATDLQTVETELAAIEPERYPEDFQGKPVRSYILQAQELSSGAVIAVTEFRPVLEQLPAVAGATGERQKYLILFQNDNELRPTGGFLTAYAVINVENGKVEPEKSDDIYELDQKFTERLPIPDALGRYLTTERYWNLRDMNIDPDFKRSMDTFYEYYSEIRGEPDNINGIIAVDTEFLTDLLRVLGPVEVPGYGTFSAENDARCDCPQIIYVLSEIITRPTPYLREDRKGILGPLMRATLTKAYGAPKQQWPALFESGLDNIAGRHVQFYFLDEASQAAAETAGAAGRLPESDGDDFLAIVNANLGGAKSNLFTEYSVEQVVEAPVGGKIRKTVTITYKNTRKADNCNLEAGLLCLNSTLRDWTRLYVPAGSTLVEAQGFTEEVQTYDEEGHTVFDGFFVLEPLGTAKLQLTYEVPYEDSETYRLDLWKQGGIETYSLLMDVTGGQEQLVVDSDLEYETQF